MLFPTLLAANLLLVAATESGSTPRKWIAQVPGRRPPIATPPRPGTPPGPRLPSPQAAPPPAPAPAKGQAVITPSPNTDQGDAAPGLDIEERRKKAKFTFEFSKAEVTDIVKAISDMTQQNFIIPEKIKGQRITILSPSKITAAEAYQVFYTALAANGISIVRSGRFYKLVDAKDAAKDTIPTCIDADSSDCNMPHEQIVTLLLHMRHVDAGAINGIAKALLSKDGDIQVFQPSNALIISEYAPNLHRVRRIIDALDVAGSDDELHLIQVQYSSATEMSEKLQQVFDVTAAGKGGPTPGGPGSRHNAPIPSVAHAGAGGAPQPSDEDILITKIVPDDRTNQLIVKANKKAVEAIKNLLSKLDVPMTESEQGRVHVYYLENAKAEELASTLSSLASGQPAGKKGGAPGAPATTPTAPGGGGGKVELASLFEGDIKITADKATNSLLIMSSAHDYRAMQNIIQKLDKPRRQVYVEAAILEVNVTDNNDFALNFHAPFSPGDSLLGIPAGAQSIGFLQSSESGEVSPTLAALNSPTSLLTAVGGTLAGIIGPPKLIPIGSNGIEVTIPTFGVLLKWLTSSSTANVLSTPHLLTTDNEQAKIEVGEKVPFNSGFLGGLQSGIGSLAQSTGQTSTGTNPLGTLGALGGLGTLGALGGQVQRIDVSLKLTLTPQINEHNKIRLEIDQTVEDITNPDAKTNTPTTSHRAVKTVVVVDDQQTVVLGGLIKDTTTETENKIPFLGDVPLIGWLFKTHQTKIAKKNLLLVLTPYIISGPDDFTRIFERKMREHDEFADEYYGHRQEYRAHIDYTKKMGPFGRMVHTLRRERARLENGGIGDGSEVMVSPKNKPIKHHLSDDGATLHSPGGGEGEGGPAAPAGGGGEGGAPAEGAPASGAAPEGTPAASPSGAGEGAAPAAPPAGGGEGGAPAVPAPAPSGGPPPGFVPFPPVPPPAQPAPAPAEGNRE